MHEVSTQLLHSLAAARVEAAPYRHWLLADILPADVLAGIDFIPAAPPAIEDTQGRRETHNASRRFFAPPEQAQYPACRSLAQALQSPDVTNMVEQTCDVRLTGSYLRIEHCLDTDGFWLEPHTDIGAKFFTMLIYLAEPPANEDWGTDIYASATEHAGTAPYIRNHGLIFIPGANTWHGFRKRPITGVRRSLIVNYVTQEWRARHELAFPEQPIG
jgi:hypothetical protein